jgi:uncharacterized membrane protein
MQFDSEVRVRESKKQPHVSSRGQGENEMLYIKSAAVGLVMVVAATIVYVVAATTIFLRSHTPPPGAEVSFDLRSFSHSVIFWVIAIAAFAVGFYWEFRRAI